MKKIVVTGGAGFIGSNIVDMLIQQQYKVVVVDDLSTGKKEYINPNSLFRFLDIAEKDTQKTIEDLTDIFSGADVVFHVAALPRVEPSIIDPTLSHKINMDGTYNVFWAAKQAGVKHIVFSSSSSIYGDAISFPTKETELPKTMSPYALQKLMAEQYAELFHKLYDIHITCLRYFNVYGSRQPTEGSYVPVVGIWLEQFRQGKPLTITGDGKQSRDFVNVFDVVKANLAVMHLKGFNVFNVGAGYTYELNWLAKTISDNIEHIAPRIEPKYTLAAITKLRLVTGWRPQISLEKYIKKEIEKIKSV